MRRHAEFVLSQICSIAQNKQKSSIKLCDTEVGGASCGRNCAAVWCFNCVCIVLASYLFRTKTNTQFNALFITRIKKKRVFCGVHTSCLHGLPLLLLWIIWTIWSIFRVVELLTWGLIYCTNSNVSIFSFVILHASFCPSLLYIVSLFLLLEPGWLSSLTRPQDERQRDQGSNPFRGGVTLLHSVRLWDPPSLALQCVLRYSVEG